MKTNTLKSLPLLLAGLIVCAAGVLSCAGAVGREPVGLRFAIMGNTFAQSPFIGKNESLPGLIKRVNEDNPAFVVHLGDIIHGGREWMGIKATDLDRQFRDFREAAYSLRPVLFTVKGEKDLLGTSAERYSAHMKRSAYYSFNYGNVHFIVLDTCDPEPCTMGDKQINWLKKDLRRYKDYPAIFMFTHHPIHKETGTDTDGSDEPRVCDSLEHLHDIIKEYPVTAVISGHLYNFSETKKDKVLYVSAGIELAGSQGKNHPSRRDAFQYYLFDFDKGVMSVTPKRID